jgi:hypothetical protein
MEIGISEVQIPRQLVAIATLERPLVYPEASAQPPADRMPGTLDIVDMVTDPFAPVDVVPGALQVDNASWAAVEADFYSPDAPDPQQERVQALATLALFGETNRRLFGMWARSQNPELKAMLGSMFVRNVVVANAVHTAYSPAVVAVQAERTLVDSLKSAKASDEDDQDE